MASPALFINPPTPTPINPQDSTLTGGPGLPPCHTKPQTLTPDQKRAYALEYAAQPWGYKAPTPNASTSHPTPCYAGEKLS